MADLTFFLAGCYAPELLRHSLSFYYSIASFPGSLLKKREGGAGNEARLLVGFALHHSC